MNLNWLHAPHELRTPLSDLEIRDAHGHCLGAAIPDGARCFVDPLLDPRHGDYVLIQMPHKIPGTDLDETIKQFQVVTEPDGAQVKLICNSAGRFRLVEEKILGVVVAFADTGRPSEFGALVDAAHAQCIENIERMGRGVTNGSARNETEFRSPPLTRTARIPTHTGGSKRLPPGACS